MKYTVLVTLLFLSIGSQSLSAAPVLVYSETDFRSEANGLLSEGFEDFRSSTCQDGLGQQLFLKSLSAANFTVTSIPQNAGTSWLCTGNTPAGIPGPTEGSIALIAGSSTGDAWNLEFVMNQAVRGVYFELTDAVERGDAFLVVDGFDPILIASQGTGGINTVYFGAYFDKPFTSFSVLNTGLFDGWGIDNMLFAYAPQPSSILTQGPLISDGNGGLVQFDANEDGIIDSADEGNIIGIFQPFEQYYVYEVRIENDEQSGFLDNFDYLDILGDGFKLSAIAEEILGGCVGEECDGVAVLNDNYGDNVTSNCVATISGPKAKKNSIEPKYLSIEPTVHSGGAWGLPAWMGCTIKIYVETTAESKQRNNIGFEPKSCETAALEGSQLFNSVTLSEGVKVFDSSSNELLIGPVGSIQLIPQGCP